MSYVIIVGYDKTGGVVWGPDTIKGPQSILKLERINWGSRL